MRKTLYMQKINGVVNDDCIDFAHKIYMLEELKEQVLRDKNITLHKALEVSKYIREEKLRLFDHKLQIV